MASTVKDARKRTEGGVWETVKVVVQALLIALVIRTFFFQPFNIPSGSMIPTLLVGDYLFVNKLSYGYSKYSFNLSLSVRDVDLINVGPMSFEGRYFADQPQRGDVAVFKLPRDNETDYIKRIVGLPGDRIQVIDGLLHINGEPVERRRIGDFRPLGADGPAIRRYRETLPNGVSYNTLDRTDQGTMDNTQVYQVPAGQYFMMGDNRDSSQDSRYLRQVGYVPFENLVGKATIIFFSHNQKASLWAFWRWPFVIRWSRFFNWIN